MKKKPQNPCKLTNRNVGKRFDGGTAPAFPLGIGEPQSGMQAAAAMLAAHEREDAERWQEWAQEAGERHG